MQNKPLHDDAKLLSYKDVCDLLRISKSVFYAMRQAGQFPVEPVRLRGCVRYSRREVEQWIQGGCSPHYKGGCR